jgi:beta-lactamase class A
MRHVCLLVPLTVLAVSLVAPAASGADPLTDTAQAIADQIKDKPQGIEKLLAPSFLVAVPAEKVTDLLQQFHAKHGPVTAVRLQSRESPAAGKFVFSFARQAEMPVTLTLDARSHQVIGLWFGPPAPAIASLDEAVKRLSQLPGKTSLQLVRLGEKPAVVQSYNPDELLAIGSTFKLLVLATAVQNKTPWDQVVRLRADHRSLPSGDMRDWPVDSPVTVHTLALKMIAQSDNTATDHLIHLLGREKIESLQKDVGIKDPSRNVPFLTTADMFRLKSDDGLLKNYVAGDPAGRRALLDKEVLTRPLAVSAIDLSKPTAINQVEWFASAADLCRLMQWFTDKNDRTALDILAINPGLSVAKDKLPYAGYKGGSEAGVLNMTWLLKTSGGRTLALSATWNDNRSTLDEEKFFGLMQAMLNLIGAEAASK